MIIASSDFTHYGSRFGHTPFGSHVNAHVVSSVRSEDVRVATLLAHGQIDTLVRDRNTICGIAGAMIVSMVAKERGLEGYVADYYTSLDVLGGDASDFVAYGTILWR